MRDMVRVISWKSRGSTNVKELILDSRVACSEANAGIGLKMDMAVRSGSMNAMLIHYLELRPALPQAFQNFNMLVDSKDHFSDLSPGEAAAIQNREGTFFSTMEILAVSLGAENDVTCLPEVLSYWLIQKQVTVCLERKKSPNPPEVVSLQRGYDPIVRIIPCL